MPKDATHVVNLCVKKDGVLTRERVFTGSEYECYAFWQKRPVLSKKELERRMHGDEKVKTSLEKKRGDGAHYRISRVNQNLH